MNHGYADDGEQNGFHEFGIDWEIRASACAMEIRIGEHDGSEEGEREKIGDECAGLHPFGFGDKSENIFSDEENGGGGDGSKQGDICLIPLKEFCEFFAFVLEF